MAREAAGHPERTAVYMSDQRHSALSRAAMIVGIRRECIRMVPSDAHFRMDMDALTRAVAANRDAGFSPIAVAANAGTASTGAIDRLQETADFCAAEGLWLHVDAAYGGFAVVTEQGTRLLRGIERADSVGLNAHKWFFQPYEAGCLMVKDESTLKDAFAVRPDILQGTVWGANHPNFSNLGLQLSRTVRALKVWMSVQTFGMAAFRRAVAKGMELSARAEDYVRASPVLEAMSMATLVIATTLLGSIGWRGLWFLNAGLILLFLLVFAWGTGPWRWRPLTVTGAAHDGARVLATLSRPGPWLFGACFVLFWIQ